MDNYSHKIDYKAHPAGGLFFGIGLGILSLIISPITLIICALVALWVSDLSGVSFDKLIWLFFLAGMMYDEYRTTKNKNKGD